MSSPPPTLAATSSCRELLDFLRRGSASSVLLMDHEQRIRGIVTERDVVRRILFQGDIDQPVLPLASSPVHTICESDFLFHAIASMRRLGLHHMPAMDESGRLSGLLYLDDALSAASTPLLDRIDRLTHEETLAGLSEVKSAQIEVARELMEEQVAAPEIQSLLTHINNDIHRRVLTHLVQEMDAEGWGHPPVEFCAIVMGSGGRGESFLFPDQDHGFILQDYPDRRHADVDRYFIELAERFSHNLQAVGFEPCRGNVMANNPLWRKSLAQWRAQLSYWLGRASPRTLRLSDIFFDFRAVYGDRSLADTLRRLISERLPRQHRFLGEMARIQEDHGVALGLFGRLAPDSAPGPHRGQLNLKYHALLPLVESVRLAALRGGIAATGTLERIHLLHEAGYLNGDEVDYLVNAMTLMSRILLRRQLQDAQRGDSVSGHVPPDELSGLEASMLREALHSVRDLKERIRTEFSAQIF